MTGAPPLVRLRPRAGGAIVLVVLAGLAAGMSAPHAAPAITHDFRATTLDGEQIEFSKLIEHGPVLIDFWSTWCKPCEYSLPEIEAIHREFTARGLTVIGVSIDGPRNFSKVRPFAARMGLTYPIVLDQDGSLQQRFQVRAVPTAVLIDTSGAVAYTLRGFRPGEGKALRLEVEAVMRPSREEPAGRRPPSP